MFQSNPLTVDGNGMADITGLLRGYRQRNLENDRTSNAKDGNTVTLDVRSTDVGESTKAPSRPSTVEKHGREHCQRDANLLDDGKLDYESRQEKNAPDVCRYQQRESNLIFSARKQQARCRLPRDPEARADSGKSEEEAATTIQAVYRGYKARRRFHEIKKSALEEKRNIKKVAELLAIPMGEPARNLEPIRTSNNSANQMKNEETPWTLSSKAKNKDQRCPEDLCERLNERVPSYLTGEQRTLRVLATPTRSRKPLKTIRTIKSPVFFSNHDERTSSFSENTDTEKPISPQTDVKSTTTDFDDDAEDKQQARHTKTVQIRASNGKRPLPQRISSSILGSKADCYFLEQSLFFPDRESILVFGGADPHKEYGRTGNIGKDIYRFKPAENIWQFAGEIPQPRHHHSVAYLRGRIYVAGGADPLEDKLRGKSTSVASVWSYDPTTRTWFDEPDMLTARMDFGLVVSHGKMYAIGGQDRNGMALRTVEAFDPFDSRWREMQPMQTARVGPASVKYRDLIWVAGGMTKSKKELYTKDVECYNPIENLWLKAVPLRSPRCFASFYVVSDCLYVIGGASITETGAQSIDSIDTWDGIDCVWKEQANMSIPRHGHAVGSIGEQLFIIGGVTTMFPKTLNSVECYCCDIGKWMMKGVIALPYSICGHGTVSLPPANLLINHRQL